MGSGISIVSTKKLRVSVASVIRADEALRLQEFDFIQVSPVIIDAAQIPIEKGAATAIVFTSGNAVTALLPHLAAREVFTDIFCLEGETREQVIRAFGMAGIAGTASHAAALAQKIVSRNTYQQVIFFCGRQRREELPEILRSNGIEVEEIVAYSTAATPVELPETPHAVLFFSPSAVKSFFSVNQLPDSTTCFAIGATTAAAIRSRGSFQIITPACSTQEAMTDAIFKHFQLINIEATK